MNAYLDILRKNALKITPKRKAVICLFLKSGQRMGPQEVHQRLSKKAGTLGLPTIYRILEELKELGILERVVSNDRKLYYSLCVCPDEHHHHFICRKCKRIEEVAGCSFSATARAIEKKLNCRIEEHLLQIEGLCAACK
jgi:Fe2+ or Zn2+ uptake regulation protein